MMDDKKKIAGVMGWPISHSLSPRLHGYWIEKYGLNADYRAWPVKPEDLRETFSQLKEDCAAEGGIFRGTNLTIPLKETAFEVVDILDPSAKRIGAVNTVVVGEDGALTGRNTDGVGFTDSLGEEMDVTTLSGGTALILGAGGASRAIAVALSDLGLEKIIICNRSEARAEILAGHIGDIARAGPWDRRSSLLEGADILVNCTSLGMTGQPPLEISLGGLKKTAVVSDIVYVPLETDLLKRTRRQGNIGVDGLGMLLHQAKAGFEAWFGVTPEVDNGLRRHVLDGLKGN
ncbi:shikimate dehydrogenase [Sneathiella sp. HT1-7]|jgi:shikimate dehydrogenase|uniref:shikimate dehydrogenase n=1 Tax=Sneathiella sp. HT1-7 TaxID=2887192 RepID=UPI001D149026|nr:shikimate dehydrogenase [Sneathiella sp. HT1-7]MCC3303961.1 shikimate dehydrogenase [Sneathiella sp. HT1-7]